MPHLAILFHRLGPYHHARLRALSGLCAVTAIELSAVDTTYAWAPVSGAAGFQRVTLFQDRDVALENGRDVHARIQAALDAARPDVVAIPGWSDRGALAALLWCRRTRTPVVLLSESTAGDERRVWWKEMVKRRIVGLCQAALVGGTLHRDYVVRLGMPVERVFLGYDVVDNDHFHQGAAAARDQASNLRLRLALPERYFLASSRFVRKKNLPTLFRAYAHYRKLVGIRAWDLVVLGDGELRPELLRLREELGLFDHVLLPGFKQYAELPTYYGLAGAFIHASTVEQWGLVVNEAMAAGLPVLVSNRCGCAPDLVEPGVNGFTFDPTDEAELARLLGKLSSGVCDLASLGEASRRRIGRWTPYHFAKGVACACEAAGQSVREQPGFTDRILLRSLIGRAVS